MRKSNFIIIGTDPGIVVITTIIILSVLHHRLDYCDLDIIVPRY